ncbi:dynein axonemal heavy chain 5-like [Periplaneta americana]|uniref:dynein axonemal heavy chain 5-like n=1 Tax=Periplaneta americana TaxID=6978 RepID=UPI0037E89260
MYLELANLFQEEIESLRDNYNEFRQNPQICRNMPPVSGRIKWIRQYYKRIEEPMNILKEKASVIAAPKMRRVIRMYNALTTVFVEYEVLYHKAWYRNVVQVKTFLTLPLLAMNPRTGRIMINFDPYIMEAIQETECMWKLGLSVPNVAQIITFSKKKIMTDYENVRSLVKMNDNIRLSIPSLFIPMMKPVLMKLDKAFQPGLSTITWTSMEIPKFCENLEEVLDDAKDFVKEASGLVCYRLVAWLPRSPDLTSLEFLLWGNVGMLVYATPVNDEKN